ncbi:hypothetical protein T439DRAFT_188475 [Meredithblackwellia eburnea MCA 4105]
MAGSSTASTSGGAGIGGGLEVRESPQGFESFPLAFDGSDEEASTFGKIKRFFSSSSSTSNTSISTLTQQAGSASASSTLTSHPTSSTAQSTVAESHPSPPATTRASVSAHSRSRSSSISQLEAIHESIPSTSTSRITSSGAPTSRRLPTRLAGVAPSVRLTVAHSERGDFVQSGSSRSLSSEYSFDHLGGAMGRHSDYQRDSGYAASPTLSDQVGALNAVNLSSIPGFPLGKDAADDSRSIRSVSTVARPPSASVAHIFRRLRGEGLSKDYWIRDESSKECYDCQLVFTAFRRKHHCRICGQIFCSRCASTLIPSTRFGSTEKIRVCNLCMSIMKEDEPPTPVSASNSSFLSPDTPPATSNRSFFRSASLLREAPQPATSFKISAPLEASARPPQSQFAASHLFPRSETPYHLGAASILNGMNQKATVARGSPGHDRPGTASDVDFDMSGRVSQASSRMGTPGDFGDEAEERERDSPKLSSSPPGRFNGGAGPGGEDMEIAGTTSTAPFRRALAEDEDAHGPEPDKSSDAGLEEEDGDRSGEVEADLPPDDLEEDQPTTQERGSTTVGLGLRVIADDDDDDEEPPSTSTPPLPPDPPEVKRTQLPAHHQPPQPAITSEVEPLSLPDPPNESGFVPVGPYSRLPKGRTGLAPRTMDHIRTILRQSLAKANLANAEAWEVELMKLLIRVARYPAPNVRSGDALDIRRLVHVKKIPGGHPRDSEYIDGVVFTKNVLHKRMPRLLSNPRIMLFSFPLEYQRVENQLMSLEPILKQEREYLRNLVGRIAALRPHVVLVERNVSSLALDYLKQANIAVARNVKPEVINAVARVTQADIISSIDKLALEPRLGRCQTFRVQTFVHSMIPGRRKTFIRFEGCHQELGCTLVLRGGPMDVLAKVKKIVDVMILIVYSAKLEGHLLADERVVAAPLPPPRPAFHHFHSASDETPEVFLNNPKAQDRERISKEIASALEPYQTTALSASPWVRFPPPYTLAKMNDEDRRVSALRRLREYEETEKIIHEEEASRQEAEVASISASSSSISLRSLSSDRSQTAYSDTGASSTSRAITALTAQEDALKVLQTPQDLARQTEYREAEERHAAQLALWDAYVCQQRDSLNPADHQKLYTLETLACSQTDRLCKPPSIVAMTFYGEDDTSLGQYIEGVCRDAGKSCSVPTCGRHMMVHYKTWVHGRYRVNIIPEAHIVDLQSPELEGQIVMWSWCKFCKVGSAQSAMSEETYRLSFGKFLELCFYPLNLIRADGMCTHNSHLDHVRFWMYRGITLQITVEDVDILNIVAPPLSLRIRPEKQLQLRNNEFISVLNRSSAFWDSVQFRISSFNYDLVATERLEESKAAMEDFSHRCEADRLTIVRMLEKAYTEAQSTSGTEMTTVRRALQNKAVEWESEFNAFEQRIIPSEKDVRRLTTVQLKRLFSDGPAGAGGLPLSPERRSTSSSLAPSIELDEKLESVGLDLTLSSFSGSATSSTLMLGEFSCATGQHAEDGCGCEAPVTPSSAGAEGSSTSAQSSSQSSPAPLSSNSLSHPTLPPISSSHNVANQSSECESDSTVCAEPTVKISSPFVTRRRIEHSISENDSDDQEETPVRRRTTPGVADLVTFFSEAGDSSPSAGVERKKASTPHRPFMRRGVTERPKPLKHRSAPDVFSDGDSSYARNVGVSHLSNFADKPSRIPARKVVKPIGPTPTSLAKAFEPLELTWEDKASDDRKGKGSSTASSSIKSARLTRSPTASRSSSRAPSRPSSRADSHSGHSGRGTPAPSSIDSSTVTLRPDVSTVTLRPSRSNTGSSAISTSKIIKPKYRDGLESEASESRVSMHRGKGKGKELGIARPTTSSTNKAATATRRVPSGSGHRVSTIANHFNKLARESERERQRRIALIRGKRVRPVAIAIPTVQVFDNVRDAIKEDSDDDDSHSSDGADDEYDDDAEQPEVDDENKPVDKSPQQASSQLSDPALSENRSNPINLGESSIMDALLHHPSSSIVPTTAPGDESSDQRQMPNILAIALRPEGVANQDSSEPPSVPPSPRLVDGFPIPRMSEGESSGNERGSIMKAITNLWNYRGCEFTPLEVPLTPTEHIFADNPVLVREDEPSSILAFVLSSKGYREKLKESESSRITERTESFMPNGHGVDKSSSWEVLELHQDVPDAEGLPKKPDGKHFRLQFEEGTSKFSVKIFFAEQFDALRRNCGCSTQFVESLARCVKWESSGGKSKVDFLKTMDDRFIVKEISRLEMDSLLRFAPAYFDYMSKAFFHKVRSRWCHFITSHN